jgi:hypothetical protein
MSAFRRWIALHPTVDAAPQFAYFLVNEREADAEET